MNPVVRWLCALLLMGCSDAGDELAHDGGAHDDDASAADASGDLTEAVGRFQITLVPAVAASEGLDATPAYTSLLGRVYDGEVPQGVTWSVTAEEGDCRLLEPSIPTCAPACTGSAVCIEPGRCADFPRAFDVGTVTLRGLRAESGQDAIAIEPLPPSNSYQLPGSVRLSYPPFAEGDAIELDAEGGELSAFSIETVAIAPLEVEIDGELLFTGDGVTELRWTPPASGSAARITVRVDISHHGGQKGEIICDADDTGSLQVPSAIAAGLIDLGVAGFPSLQIARESVGAASVGGGQVELSVTSPITIALEIPGLVSCDEPGTAAGCPDGQQCQPDRRCQ